VSWWLTRLTHPYAMGNDPADKSKPQAPPEECRKCMDYLSTALDRIGSRPVALLREIGAIPRVDEKANLRFYQQTEKGVLVKLRRQETEKMEVGGKLSAAASRDERLKACGEVLQTTDVADARIQSEKATLGRRLTSLVQQSTEILRSVDDGVSLITTSPANAAPTGEKPVQAKEEDFTTIAIECKPCGSSSRAEEGARAYVMGPKPLSIVLCSNRTSSQQEIEEVLVHELIHIYDVHSRQMDLRDCRQLAYSEVRSAREAECHGCLNSFFAGICARDKATVATRNMFADEARSCVAQVFDDAFKDMTPFDKRGDTDGQSSDFLKACVRGSNSNPTSASPRSSER